MSFYGNLRDNVATKLITKYGALHTFTRSEPGAYDPASGTRPQALTTYTANMVKDSYNAFERGDSNIQVGDIKIIAEVATFEINDTVSVDSQDYRLVNVNPIKPGPTVVAYELQARK